MEISLQESISALKLLVDRLNFLHKVSQKISENKPLSKLLTEIIQESKLVMDAEAGSLLLYDPEQKVLTFHIATGEKTRGLTRRRLKPGEGIAGWVAKHKEPLIIDDCYQDERFEPVYDRKSDFTTRSMVCVPMMRKNKLIGVMQAINKKNGGTFSRQDLNIFETLASQCAIAIENARLVEDRVAAKALERELETARTIQQNLLPEKLPDFDDLQAAAMLIPAKQVGGDFYHIFRMDDHYSLFMVADVTGKGIPAALIVSTIFSYLQTYLRLEERFDLLQFMNGLNKVLMASTTSDKFVTAWVGLYHHPSRTLTSVSAGHDPTLLFRKGQKEPVSLKSGSIFLGCLDINFETETLILNRGDVLVFYTDGVTEAWDRKQNEYGMERFVQCLAEHRGEPAPEILKAVRQDIEVHTHRALQSDDITCAVIKVM